MKQHRVPRGFGHHLQCGSRCRSPPTSAAPRGLRLPGFAEGWALYAEQPCASSATSREARARARDARQPDDARVPRGDRHRIAPRPRHPGGHIVPPGERWTYERGVEMMESYGGMTRARRASSRATWAGPRRRSRYKGRAAGGARAAGGVPGGAGRAEGLRARAGVQRRGARPAARRGAGVVRLSRAIASRSRRARGDAEARDQAATTACQRRRGRLLRLRRRQRGHQALRVSSPGEGIRGRRRRGAKSAGGVSRGRVRRRRERRR